MKRALLIFWFISQVAIGLPCGPVVPEDLCQLENRIFAETDFTNTEALRRVMVQLKVYWVENARGNSVLQSHLLQLVSQITAQAHSLRYPDEILKRATGQDNLFALDRQVNDYETKHGEVVPTDWKLPPAIRVAVFTSERTDDPTKDRSRFHESLFIALNQSGTLRKVHLKRFPNELIFEGPAFERKTEKEKIPFVVYHSPQSNLPLKEGLYLLELGLTNGTNFQGWFFLSNATPSVTPTVLTPSLNQVFANANPVFQWIDFHSPKAQTFEHRKFTLSIRSEANKPGLRWWHSEIQPDFFHSLVVGKERNSPPLSPGRYWFSMSMEERWMGGNRLFIGRKSSITIPFKVYLAGRAKSGSAAR